MLSRLAAGTFHPHPHRHRRSDSCSVTASHGWERDSCPITQSDALHARLRMSAMHYRLTCAHSFTSFGTGWEPTGQDMHLLS